MRHAPEPAEFLVIEDDPHDRLLLERSLAASGLEHHTTFIEDGEQARHHLGRLGQQADGLRWPNLVLLDLNLPSLDGRDLLAWIRTQRALRSLVVIVLSTSSRDRDVARCYELGANSYVTKPSSMQALDTVMRSIERFWLRTARLAGGPGDADGAGP